MSDDAPDLVTAHFDYQRSHEDALSWAWEAVDVSGFQEPERKLEQLLVLLAAAPDDWQIGLLAAGPLENLMRYHGGEVIDRVATEAQHNLRLRQALAGISLSQDPWPNGWPPSSPLHEKRPAEGATGANAPTATNLAGGLS